MGKTKDPPYSQVATACQEENRHLATFLCRLTRRLGSTLGPKVWRRVCSSERKFWYSHQLSQNQKLVAEPDKILDLLVPAATSIWYN